MMVPATERASQACWSHLGGMAPNSSWHHRLLRYEDDDYNWTDCETSPSIKVPVTLLICLCGLVGNGAVLWFLDSPSRRNPITIYILNLAVANSTFLLCISTALVIFYGPESLCHKLGSRKVATVLTVTILFTFTASVYTLTAFSATTSLSCLPSSHCSCHHSQHLPVLVCALLWGFSFLLTMTLYFFPAALSVFILSYFLAVLTLICSGLTLLARVLCCSRQSPPGKLCAVVLLTVFFFPFLTADFGYWLFLKVFDFSIFVFDSSLMLASVNSTINPIIYFLVGSCTNTFKLSVRAACQRAFEDVTETQNRGKSSQENLVETAV